MSSYPPPGPAFSGVGQRIEEAIELIEMELRHAASYVNQAVIPQVRKESIFALRNVARSLHSFADRLDQQQAQQQAQQQQAQQQAPPPPKGTQP